MVLNGLDGIASKKKEDELQVVSCRRMEVHVSKISSGMISILKLLLTNGGPVLPSSADIPPQMALPAPVETPPLIGRWWEKRKKKEKNWRLPQLPSVQLVFFPPQPKVCHCKSSQWLPSLRLSLSLFPPCPRAGLPTRTSRLSASSPELSSAASSLLDRISWLTPAELVTSAPFPRMTGFRPRRAPRTSRMSMMAMRASLRTP